MWPFKSPRPYRLDEILTKIEEAKAKGRRLTIYIVEGEKAADRLWELGLVATTYIGGATSNKRVNKTNWLDIKDCDIVSWADADKVGKAAGEVVAKVVANPELRNNVLLVAPNPGDAIGDYIVEAKNGADDCLDGAGREAWEVHIEEKGVAVEYEPPSLVMGTDGLKAKVGVTPPEEGPILFNQNWLKRWFIGQHGDDFISLDSGYYLYDEATKWWKKIHKKHVQRMLADEMDSRGGGTKGGWFWVTQVYSAIDSKYFREDFTFNNDPDVLLFPDGKRKLLRQQVWEKEDYIRAPKPIATAPKEGDCPTWNSFIQTMCSDVRGNRRPGIEACVLTFAGSCLFGSTEDQAFLYLWGKGQNGKSVFVKVLRHIIGEGLSTLVRPSLFEKTSRKKGFHLTRLDGPRLVVADEVKEFDEELVKGVTGGDEIEAEVKGGANYRFVSEAKLIFTSNRIPEFRQFSLLRRMLLVKLVHRVPNSKRDSKLYRKLILEAPQILSQLLRAADYWNKNGLYIAEEVANAGLGAKKGGEDVLDLTKEFLGDRLDDLTSEHQDRIKLPDWRMEIHRWKQDHSIRGRLARDFNPRSVLDSILGLNIGAFHKKGPWQLDLTGVSKSSLIQEDERPFIASESRIPPDFATFRAPYTDSIPGKNKLKKIPKTSEPPSEIFFERIQTRASCTAQVELDALIEGDWLTRAGLVHAIRKTIERDAVDVRASGFSINHNTLTQLIAELCGFTISHENQAGVNNRITKAMEVEFGVEIEGLMYRLRPDVAVLFCGAVLDDVPF